MLMSFFYIDIMGLLLLSHHAKGCGLLWLAQIPEEVSRNNASASLYEMK